MLGPPAGVVAVVVEPEILDLRGDPGRERAGVEERDRPHPALALEQGGPGRFEVTADRSDHPHSCHDDSSHESLPLEIGVRAHVAIIELLGQPGSGTDLSRPLLRDCPGSPARRPGRWA